MSHQDLAITFYTTAASIKNNCPRDLNHEEVCRSVYSKLYYALYHKYLEHDLSLASSSQSSKHEEIKRRIGANYDSKTFQLYRKMYDLIRHLHNKTTWSFVTCEYNY